MITTIGLDIAKSVFQVHGVDNDGKVVIRRQLETSLRPGVLWAAAALPGRHRGLRLIAPLVAAVAGVWSQRAADATGLRQALRQTAEERCS